MPPLTGKAFALRRLDLAWQDFLDSCAGLSEADLLRSGVCGEWSVRDLIAHVTIWEEEALQHLPTLLTGGRPPRYSVRYGGIDVFNAQRMEARRGLSLADVLRQRDETHARLVGYLQSLPEEPFRAGSRFRRRLHLDATGHYRLHAAMIRAWRQG